jgi:acetyltransferase
MRIIGPNTIGSANIKLKLWLHSSGGGALDVAGFPFGHAAIISQSGAAGFGPLFNAAKDRGIGIKYLVTTGNEADLEICDFIEFMLGDEEVQSIAVLIEGVKDGERFLGIARQAFRLHKRLIVMKLGESAVGERAAQGHTASLTGDMVVFNAMVKQYGMIKAEDYDELIGYTQITRNPFQLKGKTLCAVSHSGGISGFLGDQLSKNGFDIPVFSGKTQKGIDEYLKGFGSPRNPLDLTSPMSRPAFAQMMKVVAENENVDAYVIATHYIPQKISLLLDAVAQLDKPYYLVWTGSIYSGSLDVVRAHQMPLSFSIQKFARMLWNAYAANTLDSVPEPAAAVPSEDFSGYASGYMDEVSAKSLAAALGLSIPDRLVIPGDADIRNVQINFPGPYVMKIVSDTIIHKTEMGGVLLNLNSIEEIIKGYYLIQENTRTRRNEIKGIMVEKMCPEGLDLIIGVRRDAQFGPALVLGLGGIYTELFKMTSCRLLPLTRPDIERMIDEIPGLSQLLAGYRAQPAYDRGSLVDTIERVSGFIAANQHAVELFEINPLRILPKGGEVLDCVIKIK